MEAHNSIHDSFQFHVSLPTGNRRVMRLYQTLDRYRCHDPSLCSAPPTSLTPLSQKPKALLWSWCHPLLVTAWGLAPSMVEQPGSREDALISSREGR